jgi:GTP-binding protein YchF
MRLGIIGFPQSGKTTVFNALTRGDRPVTSNGGRYEIQTAVVEVPDPRVEHLVELFHPLKITRARVTYVDISGVENDTQRKGFSGPLLNQLSQMDGVLHVVRCFDNPNVAHSLGSVDPQRDIEAMDTELTLNDLMAVTRKLERLEEELRRNGNREKGLMLREQELFQKLNDALEQEIPLRDLALSDEEMKLLSGYGLLTLKPMLVVLNIAEGEPTPRLEYSHQKSMLTTLQGRLEMDLAQLSPEEADIFKTEYGIDELGLERVISLSYDLLGYQSFFTVGEDEVRAWQTRCGASALEAAGVIHTDLQKGFIRAEVIPYDELITMGGLSQARATGRLRLEGKDYLLHDGEIMHVRFNN